MSFNCANLPYFLGFLSIPTVLLAWKISFSLLSAQALPYGFSKFVAELLILTILKSKKTTVVVFGYFKSYFLWCQYGDGPLAPAHENT